MATKPIDRSSNDSRLAKLGEHATKLVSQFVELDPADRLKMVELLAELEHAISEFRRLRPPPLFRKEMASLRLVRVCSICRLEVTQDHESFETAGATYHLDCYERATRK